MKKFIPFLLLFAGFWSESLGQSNCKILRDSVTIGNNAGDFSKYEYGLNGRLDIVQHYEASNPLIPFSEQIATYDVNGNLTTVQTNNTIGSTSYTANTLSFDYSGSPARVTRITSTETDTSGNVVAYISHMVNYDGNGNVSSLMMDSIAGSPDGIQGSFTDIVWQNGNISSVNLVMGADTLELVVTSDSQNNLIKNLMPESSTWIFESATANNIKTVRLVNEEIIGPDTISQGAYIVNNSYTYYSNGDVETLQENPTAFDNSTTIIQYTYCDDSDPCTVDSCVNGVCTFTPIICDDGDTCTVDVCVNGTCVYIFDSTSCDTITGFTSIDVRNHIRIYPNPANNFIYIKNAPATGTVKIFDVSGKEIFASPALNTGAPLDISALKAGFYHLEITSKDKLLKGSFLKE